MLNEIPEDKTWRLTGSRHIAVLAFAALVPLSLFCAGRSFLTLQCGSDWCVSGEDVRKVFTSAEFRSELGSGFTLSVYDDMENPTEKVKAANAKIEHLRAVSCRFPAITCVTDEPHRLFAQIENIPFDVTPKALAKMVKDAVKTRNEAEKLFKAAGNGRGKSAADALGRGFALLESQVGELDRRQIFEGRLAWAKQWQHLKEIDEDDRYGWRLRHTIGYGFDIVNNAVHLARAGKVEEWERYVSKLDKVPEESLSTVQRQAIKIARLAYGRGGSGAKSASDTAMLRDVLDMDRNTVWGQFALGELILAGEEVKPVRGKRVEVRQAEGATVSTPFKLSGIESRIADLKPGKEGFSDDDKYNIALYAVMRRIGQDGWDRLRSRPGSKRFIGRFFKDREWMEDFAWSGQCNDWRGAILSLEFLCRQDAGQWIDKDAAGRRFATATALEMPSGDEEFLADWLDAYRSTALAKRLHASALEQGVWRWRYAIDQIHGDRYKVDPPEQQRFLDKFYNVSVNRFGDALGIVPYRMFNCFGHYFHTQEYYKPWVTAGEWPLRRYSYIVGGVCVELSTYASSCSNAHGLPSIPVSQPGHLAFTRRQLDGTWCVNNFIKPPTGFASLWPKAGHWTFTIASEATFEGDREKRLDGDRYLELAHLAESRGASAGAITTFHRRAIGSWPKHYTAWREYGAWIVRANRPLDEHRKYAMTALKVLDGWRNPLWDLLTPYFDRVAADGPDKLAAALAEMAPMLRQGEEKLQDEGDFSKALERWTGPLERNADLMEKTVETFTASQFGTRTFFTQTLGWCANFIFADEQRTRRFLNYLPKIADKLARSAKSMDESRAISAGRRITPDLGTFIAAAEDSGDVAAFHRFATMQAKFGKTENKVGFKDKDFNGDLVSAEGMLSLSDYDVRDNPSRHPQAIDNSHVKDYTFCIDHKGETQWAMVTLAGPCLLKGIVIENRHPNEELRKEQLPFDIEISEDGNTWRKVSTEERLRTQYKVEFKRGDHPRARYVRVRRETKLVAERKAFQLSKILVYGDKLY